MMGIIERLLSLFRPKAGESRVITPKSGLEAPTVPEVHNIWDHLLFRENTQASHLKEVVGMEEWLTMEEIKNRIKEIFQVEYKNERSLYPYVKTLVDSGLFESSSIGGRMKWKRKALYITLNSKNKDTNKEKIEISEKQKN